LFFGEANLKITTNNYYGKISISADAIAAVAGCAALECYGVVDLVSKRLKDTIKELFSKQQYLKGVRVNMLDNRIYIDVHAIFKYGLSINAVSESLKKSVKYSVENFTGMIVNAVNVHVEGVRV
jgi:uncharacterized alkaline shock family protein YloU